MDWPVVGDPLYGRRNVNRKAAETMGLRRQFLHAVELVLQDPDGKTVTVESALPDDLASALASLRNR